MCVCIGFEYSIEFQIQKIASHGLRYLILVLGIWVSEIVFQEVRENRPDKWASRKPAFLSGKARLLTSSSNQASKTFILKSSLRSVGSPTHTSRE